MSRYNKIKNVLFIGSKLSGLHCVSEIYSLSPKSLMGILTLDDRNDSRSVFNEIKNFALKNKIRLFVSKNQDKSEKLIKDLNPDMCIVSGWYSIFSDAIIKRVQGGFIGLHFSLLPKNRGGSPLVWAIINGEREGGLTMYTITHGIDAGDIWGQKKVNIEFTDFISDVLDKMHINLKILLREKYLKILKGDIKPRKQNHKNATYFNKRYPKDGHIDWNKSSIEIYNFIRAQSYPYPGAFVYYLKKKMIIWRAQPKEFQYDAKPGQVVKISREGVYAACADKKSIVLQSVKYAQNEGNANQFVKSINTRLA